MTEITDHLKTVRDSIETEMDFPCSFCRAGEREYPHHDPCDGVSALASLDAIEEEVERLREQLRLTNIDQFNAEARCATLTENLAEANRAWAQDQAHYAALRAQRDEAVAKNATLADVSYRTGIEECRARLEAAIEEKR